MRYIDADALIEFIEARYDITWKDDYEGGIKDACVDILEKIKNIPTADVVEVVRCKDCIHNHEHETSFGSKFHICNLNKLAFTQYADFYCAYGERGEE